MPAPLVVFIGFMGAGKTTLAGELAAARGGRHVDTDALLEERFGRSVPAVFDEEGEAAFRAAEEEVAEAVLRRGGPGIVSLGGGALGSQRVCDALVGHVVVAVDVPVEAAWRRAQGSGRPLARDREAFVALHASR